MILDEDADALLYVTKKLELKNLCRMTREEVMFFAERNENMYLARYQTLLPAEPAPAGTVPAIKDVTQKELMKTAKSDQECVKADNLFFEKTVFRRRGRPTVGRGNNFLPDAALSDTEYAILKEAEESRRALEKLQKYLSGSNNVQKHGPGHYNANRNPLPKRFKSSGEQECRVQSEILTQDRQALTEDDIAARNLTNELKKQDIQNILKSAGLPTDLPIYVDDGKGNYVDLDVDMAKMITEQQVKYRLVEGVIMTNGDTGSQLSNPANVFIPEQKLKSMGIFASEEHDEKAQAKVGNSDADFTDAPLPRDGELPDATDNSKAGRKPFVVKEIIRLNQSKTKIISNLRNSLHVKRDKPSMKIVKSGNY
ncbi:UNVERIFIED_CONTAM: hypothetical protein PYX00_002019 [Menopon gallinae]|uniref:Uncharacterized protein n=1 Tax=Menopon gallinae TaxID=328185 RepID=A0AAW2IGG1_9NEOP